MSMIMNRPMTGKAGLPGETMNRYAASGSYAEYFRDPDGNKLNVFFMGQG